MLTFTNEDVISLLPPSVAVYLPVASQQDQKGIQRQIER
jgi:hypothetical protein